MDEFIILLKKLDLSFETNDINKIIASIKEISDSNFFKDNGLIIDTKKYLKELKNNLDMISSWILNSFNSSKLTNILQFVSLLLDKCGYKVHFSNDEIDNILLKEIKSTNDGNIKVEEKSKVEGEDKINLDNIIFTNQFLNSLYALFVTISSKSDIILKSKSLVKVSLSIIAQIVNEKSAIIFLKKKRLFNDFNKILKELYKNLDKPEVQEIICGDLAIFLLIYSKIGRLRSKLYFYL